MPICHEKKFIFVHIPKCAGSSIEYLFKKNNLHLEFIDEILDFKNSKINFSEVVELHKGKTQHLSASDIKKLIGNIKFEQYDKFSIVRNPFDRLVSYYFFIKKIKTPNLDKIHVKLVHSSSNFHEFVVRAIETPGMYPLFNQYLYLYDDDKSSNMMDYVGKFETLESNFKEIIKNLKLEKNKPDNLRKVFGLSKFKLPKVNTSNRGNYREYYNSELKHIVQQACHKDCELFDYDF